MSAARRTFRTKRPPVFQPGAVVLRADDYRLETFAATAVLAEVRGHEAGHCDGSDTGQAFPAYEYVAFAFAFAGAEAVTALADERSGQLDPQSAGFDTGQLPASIACDAETAATRVDA